MENNNNLYIFLKIVLVIVLSILIYVLYDCINYHYCEYIDLKESVSTYQQMLVDKNQQISNLNNKLANYNNQIKFMNKYVSICPVDGTSLYHNYSCSHYNSADPFYVYSINDARSKGYIPCSYCESDADVETSNETIVYITNTGSKYHRASCSYLKSKSTITKEKAISQGYSPCSKCNP